MSYSINNLNPIYVANLLNQKEEESIINQTNKTLQSIAKERALEKSKLNANSVSGSAFGTSADMKYIVDNMYDDEVALLKGGEEKALIENRQARAEILSRQSSFASQISFLFDQFKQFQSDYNPSGW